MLCPLGVTSSLFPHNCSESQPQSTTQTLKVYSYFSDPCHLFSLIWQGWVKEMTSEVLDLHLALGRQRWVRHSPSPHGLLRISLSGLVGCQGTHTDTTRPKRPVWSAACGSTEEGHTACCQVEIGRWSKCIWEGSWAGCCIIRQTHQSLEANAMSGEWTDRVGGWQVVKLADIGKQVGARLAEVWVLWCHSHRICCLVCQEQGWEGVTLLVRQEGQVLEPGGAELLGAQPGGGRWSACEWCFYLKQWWDAKPDGHSELAATPHLISHFTRSSIHLQHSFDSGINQMRFLAVPQMSRLNVVLLIASPALHFHCFPFFKAANGSGREGGGKLQLITTLSIWKEPE